MWENVKEKNELVKMKTKIKQIRTEFGSVSHKTDCMHILTNKILAINHSQINLLIVIDMSFSINWITVIIIIFSFLFVWALPVKMLLLYHLFSNKLDSTNTFCSHIFWNLIDQQLYHALVAPFNHTKSPWNRIF